MEKFSYGLEFYKNNIYKLEDTALFKRKVKEAEKIEKVLFNTIPNLELVRKYIFRSYCFDKKITFTNRVNFIKGLILADSVIDYNDIFEFGEHLENQTGAYSNQTNWKELGYFIDLDNLDILNNSFDENNYIETFSSDEFDIDRFNDYLNAETESDNEIITKEDYNEDTIKETYDFDELNSKNISLPSKEKLDLFIQNKNNIINEIIRRKEIPVQDQQMVKKGMNAWLTYALTSMEDLYNIRINTLTYQAKNASDYL